MLPSSDGCQTFLVLKLSMSIKLNSILNVIHVSLHSVSEHILLVINFVSQTFSGKSAVIVLIVITCSLARCQKIAIRNTAVMGGARKLVTDWI